MKGLIIILMALSFNVVIKGQTNEPVFFHSSFEKLIFDNFLNGRQTDTLGLLLMIDKNVTIEQKNLIRQNLLLFISELEESRKSFKTSKAFLTYVFIETRNKYLKKFVAGQPFSQIFEKGEYNCVSGSALISYILNHLHFSNHIKETPFHVYIIAEYEQNKFALLESTSKDDWLITGKTSIQIQENKYKRPDTEKWCIQAAFCSNLNKTNCPKSYIKQITLANLAGLQYLNLGILFYNQSQIMSAYPNLQKAELLYPDSKRIEGLSNLIKVSGWKMRFQSALN